MKSSEPKDASPSSGLATTERYSCALHEVSNALTVVLGWLEQAHAADDRERAQGAIDMAREHAQRARVMARRTIGAEVDSCTPRRSASALVEFAVESLRPQSEPKQITVEAKTGPGTDVPLEEDGHVLQVLTNLVLNALDFSPAGGRIELTTEREGNVVVFAVQDEGPGIPVERHQTLFSAPMSTRTGGAGIGLPHSRQLARNSGGELMFVSSERGARFELHWPVQGSTAVRPNIPNAEAEALDGARVLMLEDDAAISSLVDLSLEARGAEVIAVDGLESLERVLDGRPVLDAILLDLSPVEHCLGALLDRFDTIAPGAPVILMSGQPTGVPADASGRFAAWVRKPFDMEQLIATLAGNLRRTDPGVAPQSSQG